MRSLETVEDDAAGRDFGRKLLRGVRVMFDWKHGLFLGLLVAWYQFRKTAEALNTPVGERVKQAVLDWIHCK